jgi:hydrogenase nickel incorporation protein HypA/HybF
MHELSLCLSTLDIIEQHARQHHARRVTGVWLEVGALAGIEEQALRFSFASVVKNSVAENCALALSFPLARAWCWTCSACVEIPQHASPCPQCGGHALKIESGDSLRITRLEIETDEREKS